MNRNQRSDGEFGIGTDWEKGAYPTPSKLIQKQIRKGSSESPTDPVRNQPSRNPDQKLPPDFVDEENTSKSKSTLEKFRGVLLSIVPPHPHPYRPDAEEPEREVGSLFLGNGKELVRVAFWGDVADRVFEAPDVSTNPAIEVTGMMPEETGEVPDFNIYEEVDEAGIEEIDETITYRGDPVNADAVKDDIVVPMLEGEVIDSVADTHTHDGEKFEVQHLAVAKDGNRFVVELYDSHADCRIDNRDTIFVFAGWGKDLDQFVHWDLPNFEYQGKLWVREYSGLRNITQDPLPE